jgi:hypothetical protein
MRLESPNIANELIKLQKRLMISCYSLLKKRRMKIFRR